MSTKDPIVKRQRTVSRITKRSTINVATDAMPSQKTREEPKNEEMEENRTITGVTGPELAAQQGPPGPTDKKVTHPTMAEIGVAPIESPARKRRKRAPKKDTKKEYYDAFRANKSGFFGVEAMGSGEGQNAPVKDAVFAAPAAQITGVQGSTVKEAEAASLAKSNGITRFPAIQRKRVRDIAMIEKIRVPKTKEEGKEAIPDKVQAQVPMIVQKDTLHEGVAKARTAPILTVRVPYPDPRPNPNAAPPIQKRKNPFSPTQGPGEIVTPTPFPTGRKKAKLASPLQKRGVAEAVVRDLIEHNPNNSALIKKLKRILPPDSENKPERFIYMTGSPKATAGKPAGSDSSCAEKGNPGGPKAAGMRLPPQAPSNPAGETLAVKNLTEWGHVARENMVTKSQPYNLLEHVRNANPGSGSGVQVRMLDDRFLVPKTNFKNGFLVHKGLEKYFNHSTGARLSLSQHFPQGFTLPQPSDNTLAHIALQIHHSTQQAGVVDTIGGWAVMPVIFSCGRSKIAGVGVVLPDVKLAARIDFRGWPFLVEGAEVAGEKTVETSRTGSKETKENKQHNETDQKILDAAKALTKLHQHHDESDTDTEPFMETKIVKVSENPGDSIFTTDNYQDETWSYTYTPPSRLPSLEYLKSTIMRADHLTTSFAVYDTTLYPGEIVHTNNSSMGRVCARRVYTSLKDNAMPRIVTREYCAETLDGSGFCQVGDKGSRVWRGDGSVRECGRILATVVGTGAALVSAGLICPLRTGA